MRQAAGVPDLLLYSQQSPPPPAPPHVTGLLTVFAQRAVPACAQSERTGRSARPRRAAELLSQGQGPTRVAAAPGLPCSCRRPRSRSPRFLF